MRTLKLKSNDLFVRYGGNENVVVLKLDAQNSSLVKADEWDQQYTVGSNQPTYQSLTIFDCEIKGEVLKKLASDLHQSRLLVNREGYCYLESEIVDTPTSTTTGFSHVEYYRINDLFGWSEYKVVKSQITTIWDRRDLKNGKVLISTGSNNDDEIASLKEEHEKEMKLIKAELDETKRKLDVLQATNKSPSQKTNNIPPPPPMPKRYPFETEDSSQIRRCYQKMQPGTFMFQVESYRELQKTLKDANSHEFQSPEFSAGDFKWVLCLYLRDNEENAATSKTNLEDDDDRNKGFISMYLKKRPDKRKRDVNVKLMVRFFIFNYTRKEYVTIQDLEVMVVDDQINKEVGIAQAITTKHFEDKGNGFLYRGTCIFGVEVMLMKNSPYTAGLSLHDDLESRLGKAPFPKYSALFESGATYSEKEFGIDIYTWKVKMYRNGRGKMEGESLSVYLHLVDTAKVSNGEHLFVDFELRLKSIKSSSADSKKYYHFQRRVAWFTDLNGTHGFEDYIPLSRLKESDCMTIEVFFNKLFKLKDI